MWVKPIQWVAVISYLFVALYYFAYLPKYLALGWMEGCTYILVSVGFTLLFISANFKLRKLNKDPTQIEDPKFLFDPYSTIGWTLLSVHFIAILLLPTSIRFVYYYAFGLLGYLLLSQGYVLGTYLIVLFYIFSIAHYKRLQTRNLLINYLVVLSKVTIGAYMGTFSYIDFRQRIEKKA